jgi:hypothetical protein
MYMKKFFLFSIAFLAITALTALTANTVPEASIAKARLMTLEEIKSFGPGFDKEWHCKTNGDNCNGGSSTPVCCMVSGLSKCEYDPQGEESKSSSCGGWFDPCDKTCATDPYASCGRDGVYNCTAATCTVGGKDVGVFGGDPVHVMWNGDCGYQMAQCHDT